MYADYGGPMSETPIVQKGLAALPEPVKGAVITVSDRCVSGEREDLSGPLAQRLLAEHDVVVEKVDLVPDGVEPVREAIRRAVAGGARVVLTTGGTGVTPRDLTPEATAPLLETRIEGIEAQIRADQDTAGGTVPWAGRRDLSRRRRRPGRQRPRLARWGQGHRCRRRPPGAPCPGAARRRRPLSTLEHY